MEEIKTQQELFHDWKDICNRISDLSGYIQNPFDMMLLYGDATKPQIRESISIFEKEFNDHILRLQDLKEQIVKLMDEKSKIGGK